MLTAAHVNTRAGNKPQHSMAHSSSAQSNMLGTRSACKEGSAPRTARTPLRQQPCRPAPVTHPSNVMRSPRGTPSGGVTGSTWSCASLDAHSTWVWVVVGRRLPRQLNVCACEGSWGMPGRGRNGRGWWGGGH